MRCAVGRRGCCGGHRGKPSGVARHRRRHRPGSSIRAGVPGVACLAVVVGAGGLALTLALPRGASPLVTSPQMLASAPAVAGESSTAPMTTTTSSSVPATTDPATTPPSPTASSLDPSSSDVSAPPSVIPSTESPTTVAASSSTPDTLPPTVSQEPAPPVVSPPMDVLLVPSRVFEPVLTGSAWPVFRLPTGSRVPSVAGSVLAEKVGRHSGHAQRPSLAKISAHTPRKPEGKSVRSAAPSQVRTSSTSASSSAGLPLASQPSASATEPSSTHQADIHIHLSPRRGPVLLFCSIVALGVFLAAGAAGMQGSGSHRRT